MPDGVTEAATKPRVPRPRYWPLCATLGLAVLVAVWVWVTNDLNHQRRNLRLTYVGFGTGLVLAAWFLFFSRLRWRVRLSVMGSVISGLLLVSLCVRIRGVTGDLVPVLEWRWARAQPLPVAVSPNRALQSRPGRDVAPDSPTNNYPQFLGPVRHATLPGPDLARDWQAQPPQLLWRHPVGTAWSGFAIAGNYAVTQEQRGEKESVVCYDLLTGDPLWVHADQAHYTSPLAGEGPRATPTISNSRVFTLGATGILNCLALDSGKLIWTKNILDDNHARAPGWGMSGSPLVTDDLVVVSAGGTNGHSLVAYRANTGVAAWAGGSDAASYSSPGAMTLSGSPQILIFNEHRLTAHEPTTGRVLWEFPWPATHPHIAMPVQIAADQVLISSGYGTGSACLEVRRDSEGQWSAEPRWKTRRLKAKFTNVVDRDGYIYGLDDGILVCLDAGNGEQKWKAGRYGHGQVILVRDVLLVTAENGEVFLIEPVPEEWRELAHFTAFRGKTWNPPALAGEYLLVRNDLEAACFRLPMAKR